MIEEPDQSTAPAIDVSAALERIGGDESFLKELLDIYRSDFEERLSHLSHAVENKDCQAVREIGHALKGSSANLSLLELQTISRSLEIAGKDSDLVTSKRCLKDLEAAFLRLKGFVNERYAAFW